jgi:hypothetical protein
MPTNDELLVEASTVAGRYWFIRELLIADRTDQTITVHFNISSDLFAQVFQSQRNNRMSLALIGPGGRLYGRDYEHGIWHRHPFAHVDVHELTPEGLSLRPIMQFMAEVEELLVAHELI